MFEPVPCIFLLLFCNELTNCKKHKKTERDITIGAAIIKMASASNKQQKQPTQGNVNRKGCLFSLGSLKTSLPFNRRRRGIEDEYEFGAELGRGHYGVVFRGEHKITGNKVAIKRITKRNLEKKAQLMIEREIECMNLLNDSPHPNIVRMLDMHEDAKYYYLVLEMCGGGELFDEIVSKGKFSEGETKRVMHAILRSVSHMHARGIVHRDLKPENIIYCEKTKSVKMIDFGLARNSGRPESNLCTRPNLTRFKSRVGTPYYIAPEVIRKDYSASCDEWSCGVIMYILLCGFPPFNGPTDAEIFKRVKEATFNFPNPEWTHISSEAKDLISQLLSKDPEKRITAQDALEHSWFDGIAKAKVVDAGTTTSCTSSTSPVYAAPVPTPSCLEPVAEEPVVEGACSPSKSVVATKEDQPRSPTALSSLMDKTADITNGAKQAKVILEHLSSQAMGSAWSAWVALHP
jgi:serine/threonine protein kinase